MTKIANTYPNPNQYHNQVNFHTDVTPLCQKKSPSKVLITDPNRISILKNILYSIISTVLCQI